MMDFTSIFKSATHTTHQAVYKGQNKAKKRGTTEDDLGLESYSIVEPEPYSATIQLCAVRSGFVEEGSIFRKFVFDKNGSTLKKIAYDQTGRIERKELYVYNEHGQPVESTFITDSKLQKEKYHLSQKENRLIKYEFYNPEKGEIKSELFTYDGKGKMVEQINIGYGGMVEQYTKFYYVGKQHEFTFREVFTAKPENHGKIIMTLVYLRDKNNHVTSLLGFKHLTKSEVAAIMKTENWESQSDMDTEWEYDEHGNQTSVIINSKLPSILENPALKDSDFSREFGYKEDEDFNFKDGGEFVDIHPSRIVSSKTTFEYALIKGEMEPRLKNVIEWTTRYNEPDKSVKRYTYYDMNGTQLEWATES